MDKFFENFKKVKLSPEDKERVKNNLISFMAMNPASYGEPSAMPAFGRLGVAMRSLRPALAAGLIAVLLGGTTSYAAEGTLPGDLLYPVKVNVNEGFRGLLATSNTAKMNLSAELAQRRLDEAEELAALGRLDEETSAELEARFDSHSKDFEDNASKVEENDDSEASAKAYSDLESSLNAHEQILAGIALGREESGANVKPVILKVDSFSKRVAKSRMNSENKAFVKTNSNIKLAVQLRMKEAEDAINRLNSASGGKHSSKVKLTDSAKNQIDLAGTAFARGQGQIEAETYNDAFQSFQEAIRLAQNTRLTFEASDKFEIDIPVPGVMIHEEDSNSGSGEIEDSNSNGSTGDNGGVSGGSDTNKDNGSSEVENNGEASAVIKTNVGDINLDYKDGNLTLSSTLFRSTPCVNWKVQTTITKDLPPSNIVFDITQETTVGLCIQVLGTPQAISAGTLAAKDANITVKLEGKVVFEGELK